MYLIVVAFSCGIFGATISLAMTRDLVVALMGYLGFGYLSVVLLLLSTAIRKRPNCIDQRRQDGNDYCGLSKSQP